MGMTERNRHTASPAEKLCGSRDKQPGIRWPIAVDNRLDRLVDAANDAGLNTTRRELIAAIVASHTDSPRALEKLIKYYRTVTLDKLSGQQNVTEIRLVEHGPGPRKRKTE